MQALLGKEEGEGKASAGTMQLIIWIVSNNLFPYIVISFHPQSIGVWYQTFVLDGNVSLCSISYLNIIIQSIAVLASFNIVVLGWHTKKVINSEGQESSLRRLIKANLFLLYPPINFSSHIITVGRKREERERNLCECNTIGLDILHSVKMYFKKIRNNFSF